MRNHWLFWSFWVIVNALAGYVWGTLLMAPTTLGPIAGMLLGTAIFIVAYALIDKYLITHRYQNWHQALRKGVYIKAALQLLNFTLLLKVPIVPELWAGGISISMVTDILGINSRAQPFLFALTNTLLTGLLLSMMVAAISFIVGITSKAKQAKSSKS